MRIIKKYLGDSRGTTLAEMMVALAVGGLVIAAIFLVMTQLFHITTSNTNYMAAFRQVQDAGDWISRDTIMAQQVSGMTSTTLTTDIDIDDTVIPVVSTDGFPASGVISIDDELIQYASKTEDTFEGCTRGDGAAAHEEDRPAGFLVALDWKGWAGEQYQIFYSLRADSGQIARSYLVDSSLADSAIIAGEIDPALTTSQWNESTRELSVAITARVGENMQWQPGDWESAATRLYKISPRPFY